MSHISRIKTQWVDSGILIQALKDLGYEVETGVFSLAAMGGQSAEVDIRVRLRLSNDIGFRKNGGAYEIVADWFGVFGITKSAFIRQLNQRYAYLTTRIKLEEQGFSLIEEKDERGKIRLLLRRMA
ncbi:MAG: DUF1257 domain-containing protein [Chloroflexota bacterium]|jgi:hypothetical protein